jgi:membrane protein YqaA with SNARE-associated domain
MFDFSAEAGLWGLAISAFISATILPGNSEIVLIAVLAKHPQTLWPAIAIATLGNTLGGITSYWLGRLIPDKADSRALAWLRRHGDGLLLLSWVPLVGDAICVAAGWLRLPAGRSALLLALGKLARYLMIAGGWNWFAAQFIS